MFFFMPGSYQQACFAAQPCHDWSDLKCGLPDFRPHAAISGRRYWPHRKAQGDFMSYSYREAALNWLALGLLLAAWNASDDAGARQPAINGSADALKNSRPAALRGYSQVSVRAVTRTAVVSRGVAASR